MLALLALLALPMAAGAQPSPISAAETALFMSDHMKSVPAPSTLHYAVRKSGTLEQGFSDSAEVAIDAASAGGGRRVGARYLSGSQRLELPALDFARGNPVLLHFLERDIREMERLTGGKAAYFRKRIRIALADAARLRPLTLSYQGREVPATEITIRPYADDPNRERFPKFIAKYYVFVLSEAVPGTLYRAEAVIPDAAGTGEAEPLIREVLAYDHLSDSGSPR